MTQRSNRPNPGPSLVDQLGDAHAEIKRLEAINRCLRAALTDVVKWAAELRYYSEPGTELAPVFAQAKAALDDDQSAGQTTQEGE